MQFNRFRHLPELFRNRAEIDGAHDRVAALVWRQAADLVDETIRVFLTEQLSIHSAARAYSWNYEALRRKVSGDAALNAGTPGDPKVTHETMLRLGSGRGPRVPRTPPATGEERERSVAHQVNAAGSVTPDTAKTAAAAARLRDIMVGASLSRRT